MRHALLVILTSICFAGNAQTDRKVCVLDMTDFNIESNSSRMYGVTMAMEQAGIPYDTTSNLTTALNYPVMITGSRILQDAFSTVERVQIETYVANGGVLITSQVRDTTFYTLCGISDNTSENTLFEIIFDTTAYPQYYDLIDDSLEVKISIGDSADGSTFFTRYYTLAGASSMANYENGECALAYHTLGSGHVYSFGPDLRDVTVRNYLNFDVQAQRTYSNGFEPSTDVIVFLLRNIIRQHIPNGVYKYTAPGTASSAIMITHDIDSGTGMDTMANFSAYEQSMNIVAQYNITTRYFNDGWMTSFYVGAWPDVNLVKSQGHVLASHSVGHFPDFADESRFPYGSLGNTPTNYQPFYTGGITTDGTVLGELEVSRDLIEGDFGVNVRGFRAGHLAFNDSLPAGLELLGYEFNSTHSANDVLTNFPFYNFSVRSFGNQPGGILEIPMTISDVFSADPITSTNYPQKVGIWADVTRRYDRNSSNTVLLIHPNRMWKLQAMQDYVDSIPSTAVFMNFEDFGDFWRKRDSVEFHTVLDGDTLFVHMDNDVLDPFQSFVVDMPGIDTVRFFDHTGSEMTFEYMNYSSDQRLYYQGVFIPGVGDIDWQEQLNLYPNPTTDVLNVNLDRSMVGGEIHVYDVTGALIFSETITRSAMGLDVNALNAGVYVVIARSDEQVGSARFVKTYR